MPGSKRSVDAMRSPEVGLYALTHRRGAYPLEFLEQLLDSGGRGESATLHGMATRQER